MTTTDERLPDAERLPPVRWPSLSGSVARITSRPFISRTNGVRGFVHDVSTGRLTEMAT